MASRTRGRRRDGVVTGDRQYGVRDVRGAEGEAPGVYVRRAVAARAVAVEGAGGEVIGGRRDDRDVGEGARHGRSVAGEAAGNTLVGAGDRVGGIVAGRGVALSARSGRWNVVRRPAARGD